ncbi:uncharacterized protein LOC120600199 [Pteropus medius]|uniref:uncharacterized protein LOC120600199 n=1 Tax=Pteropus vampyrus TaxID=132908 RepID=UPI00196B4946|nr:uncharacterized protein LOC120600199 [Pteropus giganteus]XP_039715520.1 uncharacterized protein LOC120600199 [Pteropus giganteus]
MEVSVGRSRRTCLAHQRPRPILLSLLIKVGSHSPRTAAVPSPTPAYRWFVEDRFSPQPLPEDPGRRAALLRRPEAGASVTAPPGGGVRAGGAAGCSTWRPQASNPEPACVPRVAGGLWVRASNEISPAPDPVSSLAPKQQQLFVFVCLFFPPEFLLLGERSYYYYYFLVVITSCKNSLASGSVTIAQRISGFLEQAPLLGFLQRHLCPRAAAGTASHALGRPPSSAFRTSIRFPSLPPPWGPAPAPGSRHSSLNWGEVSSLLQHQLGLGRQRLPAPSPPHPKSAPGDPSPQCPFLRNPTPVCFWGQR